MALPIRQRFAQCKDRLKGLGSRVRRRSRESLRNGCQWLNRQFDRYVLFIARVTAAVFKRSRADSTHIRDCITTIAVWTLVLMGGFLAVAMLLTILWLSLPSAADGASDSKGNPMVPVVAAGLLTVFGAFIGYAVNNILAVIDKAGKRLGLVDMMASDILAVCNIIDQMKLFRHFQDLWRDAATAQVDAKALQARQEDYFEVWSKSITELGSLDREAIKRITRFYAYLKASRDATLQLGHWNKAVLLPARRGHVESVIVLLALCLRNARLSLDSLLEDDDPERSQGFRYVVDANVSACDVLSGIMPDLTEKEKHDRLTILKLYFTDIDRAMYFENDTWKNGGKGKMI